MKHKTYTTHGGGGGGGDRHSNTRTNAAQDLVGLADVENMSGSGGLNAGTMTDWIKSRNTVAAVTKYSDFSNDVSVQLKSHSCDDTCDRRRQPKGSNRWVTNTRPRGRQLHKYVRVTCTPPR